MKFQTELNVILIKRGYQPRCSRKSVEYIPPRSGTAAKRAKTEKNIILKIWDNKWKENRF